MVGICRPDEASNGGSLQIRRWTPPFSSRRACVVAVCGMSEEPNVEYGEPGVALPNEILRSVVGSEFSVDPRH